MDKEKNVKFWEDFGKRWMAGDEIKGWDFGEKQFILSDKQREFLNCKDRFVLASGGMGSGKTLPLLMKLLLVCLFFPNNLVLLGRQTLSLIEKVTLPEFWEICPPDWVHHDKKNNILTFFNKSRVILFGLDALQSGPSADIKKAEQQVKSLNLGGFFIDQIEEIEEKVFRALRARLRRMTVPLRQANMTCNPANFWAYNWFKKDPQKGSYLIESSLYDNKDNLPEDYIEDQLNNPENWVRRYVHGEWSPDVLIESCVFAQEHIKAQELFSQKPIREVDGIEIYEEVNRKHTYQIGIDPSEGVIDPCHISCVNKVTGKKVASFTGFVVPRVIAIKFLKIAEMYSTRIRPKLILELEGGGNAVLEIVKRDYNNIYEREVFDHREKVFLKKLGWRTNRASKEILISNFEELLKVNFPKISDQATSEEMKTFVWSDEAKRKGAGAERGFHDDRIMGTMLSYFGLKSKKDKPIDFMKRELAKGRKPKVTSYI